MAFRFSHTYSKYFVDHHSWRNVPRTKDLLWKIQRAKQELFQTKFFYVFTCEYCFSHYITIIVLILTKFTLLMTGWKGCLLAGFSLVWIANIYMSLFSWVRSGLKKEKTLIKYEEQKLKKGSRSNSSISTWLQFIRLPEGIHFFFNPKVISDLLF